MEGKTVVKLEIRKNAYFDSVTLMLISKDLKKLDGVKEALVGMGTDLNVEIAHNIGLATPEFDANVTANDFSLRWSATARRSLRRRRRR